MPGVTGMTALFVLALKHEKRNSSEQVGKKKQKKQTNNNNKEIPPKIGL